MIAACPKCGAKYRVERERVGPDGARLRCAKCQAVFRVRAPEEADSAAAQALDTPASSAKGRPAQRASSNPEPPPEARSSEAQLDRDRMVLVADSNVETAKRTAAELAARGLQPILVHDGVEALLTIQRMLPRVVVLDAALPRMYGFQICEMLKRNESLHHIRVVLVGTIYHKGRYHRPPSELYGADVYLEQPDLPEGLLPLMKQFGLELDEASGPPKEPAAVASSKAKASALSDVGVSSPGQSVSPPPGVAPERPSKLSGSDHVKRSDSVSVAASPPPTSVSSDEDELAEERAKAERLARIIVSDIILYQPDRFEEAVHAGNVVEAMDAYLDEGRTLFTQRIDARVREEKDFLTDELLRVARERGMR